ncbi:TPA: hypothetical protein HA251_07720 [Candidatus Woesearchaeota archaeon]|nr:hypothetical protein [Candidatus Woesearchaeota archaeon]
MKRTVITVLLLAALLFNIVACTTPPATGPNGDTRDGKSDTSTYIELKPADPSVKLEAMSFKSEEELLAFIRANGGSSSYGGYYRGDDMLAIAESVAAPQAMKASMDGAAGFTGGSGSNSFSATNNQVAAVDEADIIKTDGEYIYTVTGNTVFIIKAYPGNDAEIVSTIELKSQPQGLFIDGDRLAVLGNFYDSAYFKDLDFIPRQGMSFLTIYDVSNKENPDVVKEYKFEGSYLQARLYDDRVYMIVQSQPMYRIDYPTPIILEGTTVRAVPVSDVKYFPGSYDSTQFTTVHSLDIATGRDLESETVTTEWTNTIYMSEKNIYIASTESINEWDIRQDILMEQVEDSLTATERSRIEKIKETDDDVLSQSEKRQKIMQVYNDYTQYRLDDDERQELNDDIESLTKKEMERYDALTYTVFNRISVADGELRLQANGRVPGTLSNQFAMDEYKGTFRVATTLNENRWWREPMMAEVDTADDSIASEKIAIMPRPRPSGSTNNVYTLDMDLDVLDKLEGIAEGEQIYSTRFMGDRLYMVTFRQVDPFFVIDLSDAKDIEMLGQLKIPGFSRYLHPYDADTIIGIGQDATDAGRTKGLKISLFDVSDVENPVEAAKFVAEGDYSQSSAEYEHKAFLFDREKELLVIPAYSYDYNSLSYQNRQNYNGAMVFRITDSSIKMRGIIDHSDGNNNWGPMVERSLWIEDLLYTKSPNLLRINSLEDLESVKKITLSPGKDGGPYPVY